MSTKLYVLHSPVSDKSSAAGSSAPAIEQRGDYAVNQGYPSQAQNFRVRYLVLHYTALNMADSLKVLTQGDVSAHYLVPDKPEKCQGRLVAYQLVDENKRAWHAGVSQWKDRVNINDTSIGIEIVNLGWDAQSGRPLGPGFGDEQIQLVINLAHDITRRYGIAPTDVIGHSDVAPSRKVDPGPLFPWERLANAGVGAWPDAATKQRYLARIKVSPPSLAQVNAAFSRYGYVIDNNLSTIVRAFQMHFRPATLSGNADVETLAILYALIEKYYGADVANGMLPSV